MTSKSTQQYELLDRAANSQHDQSEEQASNDHRLTRAGHFSSSRAGFPARVAESIRPSKRTWIWMISSHITVTAILITTIVFGATKRTWAINEQASFLGVNLSIDNQFFFFGVFNKAADYVLNDSIERISGVLLTVWMTGNTRFPGVLPLDFELPEEMSKPWRAILNAVERWKLDPPKNKPASLMRIVSSLASGFTVLLLGGSFNVVGLPKVRWTGKSAAQGDMNVGERIERPTTQIENINWTHLDGAYSLLTNDSAFVGNTLAAMSMLDVLSDLVRTINEGSTWRGNTSSENSGFVNLHTVQRGRPTQFSLVFLEPPLAVRGRGQTNANLSTEATLSTLSIQEGPIYDFWSGNTSSYGPKSFGARNWFNFTLPILSTKCIDASNDTTQEISVTAPVASSSTFEVKIPGSTTNNPQSCQIAIQQAIVPIYVYNSTQDARDECNTPISNPELYMTYLSSQEQNAAIASSLASKLNTTLPYFERVAGTSSATVLTSLASTLTKQANSTYVNSSSVAMNYVIGSLAQHLITIASWEESDTGQRHLVGPIQWQLYGSGPRVEWEWAIACVLGIAVVILGYDLFLVFYRRIMPGPWLSVPGMMVAANSASSLRGPEDEDESAWRIGELTHDVERTKYCLSGGHDGPPELSRLDVRQRKIFGGE